MFIVYICYSVARPPPPPLHGSWSPPCGVVWGGLGLVVVAVGVVVGLVVVVVVVVVVVQY